MKNKLNDEQLKQVLDAKGAGEALTVCDTVILNSDTPFQERTIVDLVGGLRRWGKLSDKQLNFLISLLSQIKDRPRVEAEKAKLPDVPSGDRVVRGVVLSEKYQDGYYGTQHKMLVKTDEGYTLWGTVPAAIDHVKRGDRVAFRATLIQSPNDSKFGFYKRPTQAEIEHNENGEIHG